MKRTILSLLSAFALSFAAFAEGDPEPAPSAADEAAAPAPQENPMQKVLVKTTKGDFTVALDAAKAPLTVANFLAYVDEGFYAGTIFHRVIDGFMIQGGGFTRDMQQKPTHAPVKNEAANGLTNKRGTIAMARTSVVDSATAQFFINVVDNGFLDFRAPTPQGFGYCVFGKLTSGLDVLDAIAKVPTTTVSWYENVPATPVVILSVRRA